MSSAQQQNELLEKEIKKKKSKYYDIIHYPPTWSLEKKMGFKIKGDHIKFIGVLKRVEKMLNVKGEEFEVNGFKLRTLKDSGQNKSVQMSIQTSTGTGNINLTFSQPRDGHLLTIAKASGTEFSYVQLMLDVITHLLNVFLMPTRQFSEKDFITTDRSAANTTCNDCGVDFYSEVGLNVHDCPQNPTGFTPSVKRVLETSISSDNNDDISKKKPRDGDAPVADCQNDTGGQFLNSIVDQVVQDAMISVRPEAISVPKQVRFAQTNLKTAQDYVTHQCAGSIIQ